MCGRALATQYKHRKVSGSGRLCNLAVAVDAHARVGCAEVDADDVLVVLAVHPALHKLTQVSIGRCRAVRHCYRRPRARSIQAPGSPAPVGAPGSGARAVEFPSAARGLPGHGGRQNRIQPPSAPTTVAPRRRGRRPPEAPRGGTSLLHTTLSAMTCSLSLLVSLQTKKR